MPELKRISPEAIPAALEKALRYRLLNEPGEAESICRDVLAVEPGNREALVTLLLALTDQFDAEYTEALARAKEVLNDLTGEYEQAYYEGIIHERWAKAQLAKGVPRHVAAGWVREAMQCYERAIPLRAPEDPDAILRWNACARILERERGPATPAGSVLRDVEAGFGDDVPLR